MKRIFTILITLTATYLQAQQDPQYSQYQFNQMVINPAYAGSRDALSGVIDGRYQWGKLDNGGSPQTISFSFHSPLKKKRIGLGLSGYSDKIGPRSVTGVYGSIAYILPLNNKLKLSFGLRGGVLNYKFDWNAITFKDPQENMSTSTINPNQTIGDMDAGFYLKSSSFYCGLSATHLNAKSIVNETNTINGIQYNLNYPMQRHFFFVISKGFKAGENLVINPTIMIKNTKGISSTDINLNFIKINAFGLEHF